MTLKFSKLAIAFGSVLSSAHVLAMQNPPIVWTITYAPQATSVPTLSEWALLTLVLLMAAFAVYTLRKRGAGAGPLASVLLVSALALGGIAGNKMLNDARATPRSAMTSDSGGTVTPSPSTNPGVEYEVRNNTHVPQTITGVSPASNTTSGITCAPGVVVPVNGSCFVLGGRAVN
jgi:hypothetical protein